MAINNFQRIGEWLDRIPHAPEDYLQVEIIWRKKDGLPVKGGGDDERRTIRKYFFKSVEELLSSEDQIIQFCNTNRARAYIYASFISKRKVYHALLKRLVDKVTANQYDLSVDRLVTGLAPKCLVSKYLMFDVDVKDLETLYEVCEMVERNWSLPMEINTKNGYHVLCRPFDYTKIVLPPGVEQKSKCMTLLYHPEL